MSLLDIDTSLDGVDVNGELLEVVNAESPPWATGSPISVPLPDNPLPTNAPTSSPPYAPDEVINSPPPAPVSPPEAAPVSSNSDIYSESEYEEGIARYFKLKSAYETKCRAIRKSLISTTNSPSENKRRIARAKKYCISCGKAGGSKFSQTSESYTAICTAHEVKCGLDIEIHREESYNVDSDMKAIYDILDEGKDKVNKMKHTIVFFPKYIYTVKDAVDEIEGNKFLYNMKDELIAHVLGINDKNQNKEEIEKIEQIIKTTKTEIRKLKLVDTPNVREIVALQIEKLMPAKKALHEMNNRLIGIVDPNFTKPFIKLYQMPQTIRDYEYSGVVDVDDDGKVISTGGDLGGRIIRMNE